MKSILEFVMIIGGTVVFSGGLALGIVWFLFSGDTAGYPTVYATTECVWIWIEDGERVTSKSLSVTGDGKCIADERGYAGVRMETGVYYGPFMSNFDAGWEGFDNPEWWEKYDDAE